MRTLLFLVIHLLILPILPIHSFFFNIPFSKKFNIKDQERNVKIKYKLPFFQQRIVNKMNGFYGIIGPDVNMTNVKTLFDLFIGDGNIQGVFFNNGELTYVKHFVQTDKLVYEEKNGRIPNDGMMNALFFFMSKVNLLPNLLGLANTAIMNVHDKSYALYERDKPYLIDIDFENKQIRTLEKMKNVQVNHFSAHSKFDSANNRIHSIDYKILTKTVTYHQLNDNLEPLLKINIKTKYLPIVHDFYKIQNKILVTDSPVVYDIQSLFKGEIPVKLDKNQNTIIHVLDLLEANTKKRKNQIPQMFKTNESFYLFHYADCKEDENVIEIYASLYDELDFSQINIVGKYRKIVLNKRTKDAVIEKNEELEQMDLDFPIKFENKIVMRHLKDKIIDGFVVCQDLRIIKKIYLKDRFCCGEPSISYIEGVPYLITLAFHFENTEQGYVILINMKNYNKIQIPIGEKLNIGFHSIFLENCHPVMNK